jgi:hypothetical protein
MKRCVADHFRHSVDGQALTIGPGDGRASHPAMAAAGALMLSWRPVSPGRRPAQRPCRVLGPTPWLPGQVGSVSIMSTGKRRPADPQAAIAVRSPAHSLEYMPASVSVLPTTVCQRRWQLRLGGDEGRTRRDSKSAGHKAVVGIRPGRLEASFSHRHGTPIARCDRPGSRIDSRLPAVARFRPSLRRSMRIDQIHGPWSNDPVGP